MKKLKSQYRQSVKTPHINDFFWKRFPNIKSVYHKKFSTQQEKSFYSMHCVEYKNYPLKIRVARGPGLAEPWDDLPAYVYKVAKSWKHNSKRAHQYYKEHMQE
ncbi:hypothetical protein [Acinetobacter brisouii]|uniref:hypothetical protein n=1 Tax=Acinetobacter brisouii TaxID=396323 RepID=UPI0005F87562|nr:hypothetical protein [Acinetobacter brisouii]KJV41000.1 hypothetical protein VH98_01410 [Acinetobacter brisouii]